MPPPILIPFFYFDRHEKPSSTANITRQFLKLLLFLFLQAKENEILKLLYRWYFLSQMINDEENVLCIPLLHSPNRILVTMTIISIISLYLIFWFLFFFFFSCLANKYTMRMYVMLVCSSLSILSSSFDQEVKMREELRL